MRDLHNKVVCGTNATEPSIEADAPAESKLARGRYRANLSFSAKGDSAVRTAIFFVLFDFNKNFFLLIFLVGFLLEFLLSFSTYAVRTHVFWLISSVWLEFFQKYFQKFSLI